MSRVGLDWYKREPVAYLGDVQGLPSKQHAVYSVVVDLLYVHGGSIPYDPKFIAGYISDMGAAAVRTALASLRDNPRITIDVTDTEISQKRARIQVKTKLKLNESASNRGEKGGKKSAEIRAARKENNTLDEPTASIALQAEKSREEKIKEREAKASQKKKGSRLSDNWWLPTDWGEWALSEGWSDATIRLEADKFKDYWISKSGAQATKLDWLATWRNWMRNVSKGSQFNGQHTKPDATLDAIAQAARMRRTSGADRC